MASKTVFQDIDPGAVSTLGITDGVKIGVPYKNSIETVLLTEDATAWACITDLLERETITDLLQVSKAFVLPSCNMPADRVKSLLKEHKVTITNDYEKADVIITHDDIEQHTDAHTYVHNILKTKMFCQITGGYFLNDNRTYVEDYHTSTGNDCVATDANVDGDYFHNCNYSSMPHTSYLIPGLTINLAARIKNKEVQVMNAKTVDRLSATKQDLTDSLLEDLRSMLRGGREEQEIGLSLIPTINTETNVHLVWQLYQSIVNGYFNKDKALKYWENTNNVRDRFYTSNATEVLEREHARGTLNKASFKYIELLCRNDISIRDKSIFVFKVKVAPEYRHYLTN